MFRPRLLAKHRASRIALIVPIVLWSSLAIGQDPADELRDSIDGAKNAISESNLALALEYLERANELVDTIEPRRVLTEEALKWDVAQVALERANGMTDDQQIAFFADQSIASWRVYVEWRRSLDEAGVEIIRRNPNSDRIQRAVNSMGNAFVRRGNLRGHSVRDLFAEFLGLPRQYLSSYSIGQWITWLHRCPTWDEVPNPSFGQLAQKFRNNEDVCRDDWEDFYFYLEAWLVEQELDTVVRGTFQRRFQQLGQALGHDSP